MATPTMPDMSGLGPVLKQLGLPDMGDLEKMIKEFELVKNAILNCQSMLKALCEKEGINIKE